MPRQEWRDSSPLCCCEYYNIQQERSHLLGCCCSCDDFDESVDRLVTCDRVPIERVAGIMTTLQDRFRIPWRGGAKQIAIDSVMPIFIQPLLAYIASQNRWCTALVFLTTFVCLFYLHKIFLRLIPRTKFFLIWTLTSIIIFLLVFELNVVPLLEILPEENYVFVALVASSLFCLYKMKSRAELNNVVNMDVNDEVFDKATENVCAVCRKRVPPRTFHCRICQACVIKKDHHCVWFDCCIGEKNHLLFFLSLILSIGALVYGSILTLTCVCHPFFFLDFILLPDDCSDVYHEIEIALCFVSALHCLVLATFLLVLLVQQCWLISLGLTGQEWLGLPSGSARSCWGLRAERSYSRGFLRNWTAFLCCHKS